MAVQYQSNLDTFPGNILVAASASWYSTSQIGTLTQVINQVYFPITESRSSALDNINKFSPPPFSYNPPVRFPVDTAYVSTTDSVFQRIISQLVSALAYKDRLIEKTNVGNTQCSVSSNTVYYIAAFNSFNNARLLYNKYVTDYRNYIDQLSFEKAYRLNWGLIPLQDFNFISQVPKVESQIASQN